MELTSRPRLAVTYANDAVIMSRSSFSYVAAILSQKCIVVYHPFWHSPMSEWLISADDGALPEGELADRLESWKPAAP